MGEAPLDTELLDLLDRRTEIDAIGALRNALRREASTAPLAETAIGFDANVVLRLGTERKNDGVIDYLRSLHVAPLILPGQVVQEFWNNQHNAIKSMATNGRDHFQKLKSELDKFDDDFGGFSGKFDELITSFSEEYGYMFDPSTVSRTDTFLDVLKSRALVPFVERSLYADIAKVRHDTKTPPGFEDTGDGDFYVWADFLRGLQIAKQAGTQFKSVALITQDKKKDWSRDGNAHPILSAEIMSLTGKSFETWTPDQLRAKVNASV